MNDLVARFKACFNCHGRQRFLQAPSLSTRPILSAWAPDQTRRRRRSDLLHRQLRELATSLRNLS